MIGIQFHSLVPTKAKLNGPILSFTGSGTVQPFSTAFCSGNNASFTGVATAYFSDDSETIINPGIVSYRWYEVGGGALSNSTNVTGTGTTILTISNLRTPQDNGRQFYLKADYVASSGVGVTFVGNAINDGLESDTATLIVFPNLSITTQPSGVTVGQRSSASIGIAATTTDSRFGPLTYQWTSNGNVLTNGTNVSGATSPTLTLSSNTIGIQTVQCTVSQLNACNTPIKSNIVNFETVSARSIITYDEILDNATSLTSSGTVDIFDGPLRLNGRSGAIQNFFVSPTEKNIKVRITMAASAGRAYGSNRGGEGGLVVFEYTLVKDIEYNLKLALSSSTSPYGGNGAFFYEKAKLLVCTGGGGNAGSNGRGGDGGGAGMSGENGLGTYGGSGGLNIETGTLPTNGFFPGGSFLTNITTAVTAGRVSGCTPGGNPTISNDYWRITYSPCQDIGLSQFRNIPGNLVTSTRSLNRGYKPGLAHRNNGGYGAGTEGGGGSGAYGGAGSGGSGSGGGGASGYTSGNVTIVSTRLGGNSSQTAYAIIELI